jgi:calcium-dependent protein kinase
VITYILLCGRPPFPGRGKDAIKSLQNKKDLGFNQSPWKNISSDCKNFVKAALAYDYKDRPSAKELLGYPWIKKRVDLKSTLDKSAKQSITKSMREFREMNSFQGGIISLMANIAASNEELENLKKMFNELDKDRSGELNSQEIKEGFEKIMKEIEKDGDSK